MPRGRFKTLWCTDQFVEKRLYCSEMCPPSFFCVWLQVWIGLYSVSALTELCNKAIYYRKKKAIPCLLIVRWQIVTIFRTLTMIRHEIITDPLCHFHLLIYFLSYFVLYFICVWWRELLCLALTGSSVQPCLLLSYIYQNTQITILVLEQEPHIHRLPSLQQYPFAVCHSPSISLLLSWPSVLSIGSLKSSQNVCFKVHYIYLPAAR